MGIRYLDGRRLKRAILAGSQSVIKSQDAINKINVFPVPDGDTGSNMASTLESISKEAASHENPHLTHLSTSIANSAINGARGNSGAILAQFFQGIAEGFADKSRIGLEEFSITIQMAVQNSKSAVANPVEGTILTVMQDWADWIAQNWSTQKNFIDLFTGSVTAAEASLKRTPEQLKALSKANVVDAGAQGFVNFLQGIAELIKTGKIDAPEISAEKTITKREPSATLESTADTQLSQHEEHTNELEYQYCTECIIHGDQIVLSELRAELAPWGNSLVVAGNAHRVKIHMHTNDPDRFFNRVSQYGDILATKADDMWAQYRACRSLYSNKQIVLVTDSSCSLPNDVFAKYNIIVIPLQILIGKNNYLDRINITHETLYHELMHEKKLVTTSQPSIPDLQHGYEKALRQAKNVIGLFVSAKASGTYQRALQAAEKMDAERLHIIDSKDVASGLGLIVGSVAEFIQENADLDTVLRYTHRLIQHTRTFVAPATLEYLVRGGRVNRFVGKFGEFIHLLPVIGTDAKGAIQRVGLTIGKRWNQKKTMKLAMQYAKTFRKANLLAIHTQAEALAKTMTTEIERQLNLPLGSIPIVPASTTMAAHAGPGSVAISVVGIE